jgi:hypothetical protein
VSDAQLELHDFRFDSERLWVTGKCANAAVIAYRLMEPNIARLSN